MLRIGWFSTGRGEGSRGLLQFVQERILRHDLEARIEFVFSNRGPGEAEGSDQFFELVRGYDLPLVTSSSAEFRKARRGSWASLRPDYDRQVMDRLKVFSPDICVLAGYMLIIGEAMCHKYPLLNLHPARPDGPIGTWQEVIWQLIAERSPRTGAMVHLATVEVDRGPVISHCTVPLTGEPFDAHWRELAGKELAGQEVLPEGLPETLRETLGEEFTLFRLIRQAGYRKEPYLVFETLRAVAEGRVLVQHGEVRDASGRLLSETRPQGLGLDEEINRSILRDAAQDAAQDAGGSPTASRTNP